MSERAIVETWRQPTIVGVTQSLNAIITTIGVETIVAFNTDVVKMGVVIRFATNLGHGSNGFSTGRNLNRSLRLPTISIGVVGTPQMVFTNQIMTTHVHKTTNRPWINSIAIRGYKNINAKDPKGGHQEPSVIIQGIPDHINSHFVRPNKVAFKYFDFKKYVDPNVHVKV
jgi:hypothetical protein